MKAINIDWYIDMEYALEILDNILIDNVVQILEISKEKYLNVTMEERHDFAEHLFRHCPAKLDEIVRLPNEINIPSELKIDEDIANYISDITGFYIKGFDLVDNERNVL